MKRILNRLCRKIFRSPELQDIVSEFILDEAWYDIEQLGCNTDTKSLIKGYRQLFGDSETIRDLKQVLSDVLDYLVEEE